MAEDENGAQAVPFRAVGWGGHRTGAGRKPPEGGRKVMRGFRLTAYQDRLLQARAEAWGVSMTTAIGRMIEGIDSAS